MVGPVAEFLKEIKEKILELVPSMYCSDTFLSADRMSFEGQEASIPVAFRHFDISITDDAPGAFSGSYSYQHKDIAVQISVLYSKTGATRVLGNADIDFEAFISNDINDIEKALMRPITTTDGSTGRLLRQGSMIQQVDNVIVGVIQYNLAAFLRGSAKVPDLYIGPSVKHTLNGGDKVYLVCQSDLAVDVTVTSAPAGLQHVATLHLASDTPTLLELTAEAAGTYSVTISGASGTASASVQVYPASDYVIVGPDQAIPNDIWTVNLAVASANNGVFPVTGSANLTLPETVEIVNNKGVIPITITARGNHTVTVGDDTCNFTSVTPAIKIPKFDPYWAYDIYGAEGTNSSYWPLSGCIDPRVENYACINTLGDNTRRFTLAVRIKTSRLNSSAPIMGIAPAGSYTSANLMLHTVGPVNLSFYYHNVSNVLKSIPTNTALVNDSNFYSYVFNVFYDRNTNTGYIESWRNGVYTSQTALNIDYEPGYNPATWFHKFLICPTVATIEVRDIYISNICNWTQAEVNSYHAETAIDSSKYTLHWTLEKNTDLPYHVEYDSKNNMPLAFNMQTNYLTWVPKP